MLREQLSCLAIDLTPSPLRAITRISSASSWVNIDGTAKPVILAQLGHHYFGGNSHAKAAAGGGQQAAEHAAMIRALPNPFKAFDPYQRALAPSLRLVAGNTETSMLVLCGHPVSNYYSKVKLALLEKGVPFEEARTGVPGIGAKSEDDLRSSPLGKIPFIRTAQGPICESQAILEYIEATHPEPPLLPKDPYEAAKVRELLTFVDLHVELVARELYPKAFFGGALELRDLSRVRTRLERNIAALGRLTRFNPFIAAPVFTQADCSAWASFGLVSMATQAIYGEDLLTAGGIDWKPYSRSIGERPSAQRVVADRKAAQSASAATKS